MSDSSPTPTLPDQAGPTETRASPEPATPDAALAAAVAKFKSCRWRRPPEDGPECCGHRVVLTIAGNSFNPEAWGPDCSFFNRRRTPKKRNPEDYRYLHAGGARSAPTAAASDRPALASDQPGP